VLGLPKFLGFEKCFKNICAYLINDTFLAFWPIDMSNL
jgi:hypothetical protein